MSSVIATPPRTLTDALLARRGLIRSWQVDLLLITLFSGIVALSAQVIIPLPWVPITGQTFGVLLTGALLGSRRGFLALLLYLTEGAAGLPVFNPTGAPGIARLLGPTAGYLLAYPLAAGAVGWLAERGWDRRIEKMALAMIIGNVIIYAMGMLFLSRFVGGFAAAFLKGVLPFLGADVIKIVLAALALPSAWAWLRPTRET